MSKPALRARPAPELSEPKPNAALLALLGAVAPLYLRFALRFERVELIGARRLADAYRDFQEGRSRLLVAFRHPYGDEPQLLGCALAATLPREARRLGVPLKRPVHAAFVHGYEVPLWMGPFVRWLLPRVGAVPVHHVKLDAEGIARIRTAMLDGPYPLALAPEGQVSYSSESVPRLEQGFARIAFWTAEDLEKAGRAERTVVLPLSVHYRYGADAPETLERTLALLEKACGIGSPPRSSPRERLQAAAEAIVGEAEDFYAELDRTPPAVRSRPLNERWADVVQAALRAGERALRLPDDGDVARRFYRIRQAGWDRVYRTDLSGRPPLSRALADRETGEAWYAMRHMELADIGWYLDFDALREGDRIERYIEAAVNYWDLASRLRGGNISDRLGFFRKEAFLVAGEPLDVGGRLAGYRESRKGAYAALTAELERRYLDCAAEYRKKEFNHAEG